MKQLTLLCLCIGTGLTMSAQQVTISSFSPLTGAIGTVVTINGSNFSTTPANNNVYFGAVKATVNTASATTLTAVVPAGANFDYITVAVNNTVAVSGKPFNVTYPEGGMDFTTTSFAARADFSGGGNLADGDFDGDGKIDVVYCNFAENRIFVHLNTGTASTLSFATPVYFTGGLVNVTGLEKADFNGDGKLDIVASTFTNGIYIYRNGSTPGNLFFFGPTAYTTGAYARRVTTADFDGDGKIDIVTSNQDDNTVSVFKNITTDPAVISFSPKVDYSVSSQPEHITTGDLDGDGKPDIAVACSGSNMVSVLRNTSTAGTISFAAKTDLSTGSFPWGVAIGDLDADNKPDLVVSNLGPNTLSVFKNNSAMGSLSFSSPLEFTTSSSPRGIKIGDLNADGKPDIAVACSFSSHNASVLKNTSTAGTISFASRLDYAVTAGASNLVLSDMNGDGLQDILVACTNNSNNFGILSFLKNQLSINTVSSLRENRIDITNSLELYPNPSSGWTFIKHPAVNKKGVQLTVTDINGKLIMKTDVKPQTVQTILNISQLQPGVYFVMWSNGNETGTLRLRKN